MTVVYDNFVRANGALGSNWATPVPNKAEFTTWAGTPAGNILISGNGVGGDATNGLDCACLWAGGQSFGNGQWAQATFKTIANPTATLAISAAVQAAGNTTYTYTVSAGDAATPISGGFLYVIITGMADSGNNGTFNATNFAAGTFTVANASGVTRAGQSGVGYCASDSGVGVGIRMSGTSAATLNGYFFHCGTNSFNGDSRKAYYELWKVVNGAGTSLGFADGTTALGKVVPSVGDVMGISAVGSTITAYYNQVVRVGGNLPANGIFQVTDTDIPSGGVPGLWAFAVSGASEYDFTKWTVGSTQFGGNNGTTVNQFAAGDGVTGSMVPVYSDNFTRANSGNLGANWTANPSTDQPLAINSNFAIGTVINVVNGDYYSAASPALPADQYSELKLNTLNAGLVLPVVRQSSSAQTRYEFVVTGPIGSSASLALFKVVAGAGTQLGATLTSQTIASGDVFRISVRGTTITCYQNGTQKIQQTDAAIATGFASILLDPTSSTANALVSAWAGSSPIGSITGNAGVASAIVTWTGSSSGMVVADGSGNYTIPVQAGSYVITPILAGKVFSPTNSSQTLGATDISGVNFTATTAATAVGNAGSLSLRRRKRRDVIS